MKYFVGLIVLALITCPLILWIYDGKFSPVVWQSAAWFWGLLAVIVIVNKIQGKKLW